MAWNETMKALRLARGMTQEDLAAALGTAKSTISMYEKGKREPNLAVLRQLAEVLGVDMNQLTDTPPMPARPEDVALNARDQRDISKKFHSMLELFDSDEALMFDGEPLDEETRELLEASYRSQLEMTKRIAKVKFAPKTSSSNKKYIRRQVVTTWRSSQP